jgi:hypothetical protein
MRAAHFAFSTIPLLHAAVVGRLGRSAQMALFCYFGPPGWPSRSPVPAHAEASVAPSDIAASLQRLPAAAGLQWRRDVCSFLVKMWGRRRSLSASLPFPLIPSAVVLQSSPLYDCNAFTSSILRRPVYGKLL